jgi:hypothetical protein
MQIKISHVYTPSEKQNSAGILGTVNLAIHDEGNNPVVYLNGLTVRRSKSGDRFLSAPSYSIGEGEAKKWRTHFSLFPFTKASEDNSAQKNRMDSLTKEVLRVLDAGGTSRDTPPATVAPTIAEPTAAATSSSQNPWDSMP